MRAFFISQPKAAHQETRFGEIPLQKVLQLVGPDRKVRQLQLKSKDPVTAVQYGSICFRTPWEKQVCSVIDSHCKTNNEKEQKS